MQEEKWKNYMLQWFSEQQPHMNFSINPRDKLNENGAKGISEGMKQIGSKIQTLYMYVGPSKLKLNGFKQLGESFNYQTNLLQLHLIIQKNELMAEGIREIANGIGKCQQLQDLQLEIAPNNNIGQNGGKYLGAGLSSLDNLIKLKIKIEQSKLQSIGLIGLLEGIAKCSNLEDFDLYIHDHDIDGEVMDEFKNLLIQLKKLQCLKLVMVQIQIQNSGAKQFKNIFSEAKLLKKLEFNFTDSSLTQSGWQDVFEGMAMLENIEEVYIQPSLYQCYEQQVRQQGCLGLKQMLQNCSKIRILHLNLQFCYIDNDSLKVLGEGLQKAENIQTLRITLYGNPYSSTGLDYVVQGIEKLSQLITLSIKQSQARHSQMIGSSLFESLQKLEKIRILDLTSLYLNVTSNQIPLIQNSIRQLPNVIGVRLNFNFSYTLNLEDNLNILDSFSQNKKLNYLFIHFPAQNSNELNTSVNLQRKALKLKRLVQLGIYVNYSKVHFS